MSRVNLQPVSSSLALALAALMLWASPVCAQQSTSFTYQGRLTDGGTPENANYDLQFALFDNSSGGAQIGSTLTRPSVLVGSGIFTVQLDFGVSAFPGADRFLEIGVKPIGGVSFTTLSPRQQISSTPYAIRTLSAATADTATTATTATNATQLGGVAASQYVQTNDSRLTDSRPPTAGSSNYIQNTTPGAGTNFNISGNGTAGGTLNGNVVNATTQYNLGGQRVLSNAGNSNLFAGVLAGQVNTSGTNNVFVGPSAGRSNTIGGSNSFFGYSAGSSNAGNNNSFFGVDAGKSNAGDFNNFFGGEAGLNHTTGDSNNFFGSYAGRGDTNGSASGGNNFFGNFAGFNVSTGGLNSLFGDTAGLSLTTGSFNTFIGASSGNPNSGTQVSNSTAIGYNATVSCSHCMVLGDASDNSLQVGIGTTQPSAVSAKLFVDGGSRAGVFGLSDSSVGVDGRSDSGYGVYGVSASGYAGYFAGKIHVASVPFGSGTNVCVTFGGDIVACGSSLRFKTNVHPFLGGLDIIRRLRPINFDWKDGSGHDIGLGAEDVAKVAPSFAITDKNGEVAGVKYDKLTVVLINAIKEQQNQIEIQRKQIVTLLTANATLNTRLRGVEKVLRKKVRSTRQ